MTATEGVPSRSRRSLLLQPQTLAAIGVFSSGLLLAEVNVFSSRHYHRTDLSKGQLYSLSQNTQRLLDGLTSPVEIIVFSGTGDPLSGELRQSLTAYETYSALIKSRYVDPDRDPAIFLALTKSDELADGRATAALGSPSCLIRSGERTWFVQSDRLTSTNSEGHSLLHIEAELTEGIAQVNQRVRARICFVTGHGERSLDDTAPEGLIELRRRLEGSNLTAERVPLDVADPALGLLECDSIAVVGPARPWPAEHAALLLEKVRAGTGLVAFLDPIVAPDGQLLGSGLVDVLKEVGVVVEPAFVLERDAESRLPTGVGEVFFATPRTHVITAGLSTDEHRVDSRALIVAAMPLRQAAGGGSQTLLETSPHGVTLSDLKRAPGDEPPAETEATLALAMAQHKESRRAVVVGTSNLVTNRSFREPALHGNRLFSENAFSWLQKRAALVSVPEKPPMAAGLNLTEHSLGSLFRYVLIYMPLAAALSGAYVYLRRKRLEESSRTDGAGGET